MHLDYLLGVIMTCHLKNRSRKMSIILKTVILYYCNINFILLIVPMRYFCCGPICFMFWSQIFVLFEPYVRFRVFI